MPYRTGSPRGGSIPEIVNVRPVTIYGYEAEGGIEGAPPAHQRLEAALGSRAPETQIIAAYWDSQAMPSVEVERYVVGTTQPGKLSDEMSTIELPGSLYLAARVFDWRRLLAEGTLSAEIDACAIDLGRAAILNSHTRNPNAPELEVYYPHSELITTPGLSAGIVQPEIELGTWGVEDMTGLGGIERSQLVGNVAILWPTDLGSTPTS